MRGARDPNAAADSHSAIKVEFFGGRIMRRRDFTEPKWAGCAEIDAIYAAVDA
jgi:hypothetical protein